MAKWLGECEVPYVWLLGRSGRSADPQSEVVWQSAARMSGCRCDSSCSEEASSLVPEEQPMRGVVHAGGVLQDAIVGNMTLSQCRAVFAPKVAGLHNMQTGIQMAPMHSVVLF